MARCHNRNQQSQIGALEPGDWELASVCHTRHLDVLSLVLPEQNGGSLGTIGCGACCIMGVRMYTRA
jgi:hypothetical protein